MLFFCDYVLNYIKINTGKQKSNEKDNINSFKLIKIVIIHTDFDFIICSYLCNQVDFQSTIHLYVCSHVALSLASTLNIYTI